MSAIVVSDISRTLAEGWRWWIGELKPLVPTRLLPHRRQTARADIHISSGSVEIERITGSEGERLAESRPIESFDEVAWRELDNLVEGLEVRVILAQPDIHATTVRLPRVAARNLKSTVLLQLGQIAPMDPSLLTWQARIIGSSKSHIDTRIMMARSERIDAIQTMFVANGLSGAPVYGADGGDLVRLAPGLAASRTPKSDTNRRIGIYVAILLASIPFTTWIGAALITSSTEARIKLIQREVAPRIELERRAQKAEALRRTLAPITTLSSVSDTIEDLANRLPETAHLTSIEQRDDRKLRLTVEASDADVLEDTLSASPLLPDIRVADQTVDAAERMLVSFETAPR